jgi:hypothetical protein
LPRWKSFSTTANHESKLFLLHIKSLRPTRYIYRRYSFNNITRMLQCCTVLYARECQPVCNGHPLGLYTARIAPLDQKVIVYRDVECTLNISRPSPLYSLVHYTMDISLGDENGNSWPHRPLQWTVSGRKDIYCYEKS